MLRPLVLALSSAVLMCLALPNEVFAYGLPPLGFLALVPLYSALLDMESYRAAALLTGLFGALQHALTSYWLWFFKDFRFWTLGSTTIAYFLVYSALGLYLFFFIKRSGRFRAFAFALLWTVIEYSKSNGFLGYPWGLIPYSLTEWLPLLQIAELTGVYGISYLLALSNAVIAEFLLGAKPVALARRTKAGYAGAALALIALTALFGVLRMSKPVREKSRIRAVLVQQNIDPWDAGEEAVLSTNISLARRAIESSPEKPVIVLFSETTLSRPYADFPGFYSLRPRGDPLIPFIKESGAWLLTGAPIILDWDTQEATNSVILIDPEGRQRADYAKVHPVPFAEAIPFWDIPAFRSFIQNTVGLRSGWVMGTEYSVFELPTEDGILRFGAPICFEDAFADVCRQYYKGGADLIINLTNDSWSKTVSAEIQHWAAARFRAIEHRKTLVRSTNGGLSCVVGPYGEILDQLPIFESTARSMEVPVYGGDSPTAYALYGDFFAWLCLLLSVLWALILIVRSFKRGGPRREHHRVPRIGGA